MTDQANAETIAENLSGVREQIRQSCERYQRSPDTVTLLAVSKTKPAEALKAAWQAGQRDFGENYLQESLEKQEILKDLDICWHFIGPIQSNKTRAIAESFQWVHSVDRLKVAQRLNDQRPEHLPPLNICLQINISEEATKSGITLTELPELAAQIAQMPNLTLRGLMAIPAPADTQQEQRKPFAALQAALFELKADHPQMDTLSMGMTGDMDAAIAEGSTMVRIGTAIFGARSYPA
ncbi:YggS family pyridoxal phosphate-dependent enzyme [Oceanospirillum sediminis]|uniref:Pyridoxal phosphate homeostasis protein n=1 Tax=Oceanospirillum sediminis TaxID=2760088 RepID=A0A839INB8_9GAMM|nr:YggS family pyridoxal phosphate-dependent enzyme [Oceanospirillum sediminis]MBB1486438.1 YggS family pyridoxal phosphate-dependent enzyme [Oceanospirillum sediminis]